MTDEEYHDMFEESSYEEEASLYCDECGTEFHYFGDVDNYLDGPNYIECQNCGERIVVESYESEDWD